MKKKFIGVCTVVGLLAVTLAGCGNGNGAENSDTSSWNDSQFISVVSREDGSGTRGAFVEIVGILEDDHDRTTLEAIIGNSTSVVKTSVAGDAYAIGYISIGALDDDVRALEIDGVAATEENAKTGDYRISRPFNIATTNQVDSEVARDLIDFIMSAEGQEVVAEAGFIAIPDLAPFNGSLPAGRAVVGGSTSVAPVMERLIEAYQALNPDAEIELQVAGSSAGMSGVLDGNFDIGMASRELSDSELEAGLEPIVIAMDGIAVIVNVDNPLVGLTMEQVRDIFIGEIMTWDEVLN